MATRAETLTDLQAELVAVKAAISSALTGGASMSADGLSITRWRLSELRDERTRIEKSIQRLLRGGRGLPVDMSVGVPGSPATSADPDYDVGFYQLERE